MDAEFLKDRRVVLALGGGLALIAGLGIAIGLMARNPAPKPDPDAPRGSLQVEMGPNESVSDVSKPLRCFVGGQFIGVVTLNECAKRNGVATGSLDVGLDPSGAIVAGEGGDLALQPLPQPMSSIPPVTAALDTAPPPVATASPIQAAGGACWRFNGAEWRKISASMTLNECVQALFAGRCERPGAASYGRWSDQTLRLVTGRVERSADNRNFRTLVQQPGGECSVPPVSE